MSQLDLHQTILERIRSIYAIRSALALQGWDQECYMPVGGGSARAHVISELTSLLHKSMTDSDSISLMREGLSDPSTSPDLRICITTMLKDCNRKAKLPLSLDMALASSASLTQHAWAKARDAGDVHEFQPKFKQLVHFKKQEAECLAENGQSQYEALLQSYEPGITLAQLDPMFDTLETGLTTLLDQLRGQDRIMTPPPFAANFPKATQATFLHELLPRLGFDLSRGRLDQSAHPFTEGLHRNDVRITVRYREDDILDSYFSLMHECGHGLYEQGFQEEWNFTPLGEAVSLGVHESQSRFWENCIGRSREYWEGELPLLQQFFPSALDSLNLDSFMARVQAVHPSLIRVQADEVTYNFHILLRFRIERMILEGSLNFNDIESVWNSEMQRWFMRTPVHLNEGYLQDVHWSAGLFGYFPTYTLGNLWAAQIRAAMVRQFPHFNGMVGEGRFGPILQWLREHIHTHARRFTSTELMRNATGSDLDPQIFLQYLRDRYLA